MLIHVEEGDEEEEDMDDDEDMYEDYQRKYLNQFCYPLVNFVSSRARYAIYP